MSSKIIVLPASTQAGRESIKALLAYGKQDLIVHGVYRNLAKAPSEFVDHPHFKAIQGDVSSGTLDFSGAEAVFYIPPPTYDGTDTARFARNAAQNVQDALQKATVKRLVLLSAIGSQHSEGIGILKINHIADNVLKCSVPEVTILKAGFFMENWASALDTIKSNPEAPFFEAYFTPLDYKFTMISVEEIGRIAAEKLLQNDSLPFSPQMFDLHGPSYSTDDVRDVLQCAVPASKKITVKSIEPDQLFEFYSRHVPPQYAQELVEMTVAMIPGGVVAPDLQDAEGDSIIRGDVKLVEVLRKLASEETTKAASGAF